MSTVHVIVIGRVQGVFYRQSTRERASSLGLAGWVRNMSDGTVQLKAFGERAKLEELLAWCKEGPPSAVVQDLVITWLDEEERGTGGSVGFVIH